jgi:hypothetical protein
VTSNYIQKLDLAFLSCMCMKSVHDMTELKIYPFPAVMRLSSVFVKDMISLFTSILKLMQS